jgi:hypothetical protein
MNISLKSFISQFAFFLLLKEDARVQSLEWSGIGLSVFDQMPNNIGTEIKRSV